MISLSVRLDLFPSSVCLPWYLPNFQKMLYSFEGENTMSIHSDSDITAVLCVRSRKAFAKRNCAVRKNLTVFPENFHRFPGENIRNVRYALCRHRCCLYSSMGLLLHASFLSDVDSIQDSTPSVGQRIATNLIYLCLGDP